MLCPAGPCARCPVCLECEWVRAPGEGVGEATHGRGSHFWELQPVQKQQGPWLADEAQSGQATSLGGASLESSHPDQRVPKEPG